MNKRLTKKLLIIAGCVVILVQLFVNISLSSNNSALQQQFAEVESAQNTASLYLQPSTISEEKLQYLVAASVTMPLNDATKNIVYASFGNMKDGTFSVLIGKAFGVRKVSPISLSNCKVMVSLSTDKSTNATQVLASEITLADTKVYIFKNANKNCYTQFTQSELDALVDAAKNMQVR